MKNYFRTERADDAKTQLISARETNAKRITIIIILRRYSGKGTEFSTLRK